MIWKIKINELWVSEIILKKDDETMSFKFQSNFFLQFTLTILLGYHYNEKYSIKRNQNQKVFFTKKNIHYMSITCWPYRFEKSVLLITFVWIM